MDHKTTDYIERLFFKQSYEFKFSEYTGSSLLPTCFSVMTLFLIDSLNKLQFQKEIQRNILEQQTVEGYFIDRNLNIKTITTHDVDYLKMQFTYFSLIALDILGTKLPASLHFINSFLDLKDLINWLDNLDMGRIWYESNKIMFLVYFLSYIEKFGSNNMNKKAKAAIEIIFDFLDSKINVKTGLWGGDLKKYKIQNAIYGAAHLILYYDYYKRDIQSKEKIIDRTLSQVKRNGLWASIEGGACEDYNGTEILLRLSNHTKYRENDIKSVVQMTRKTILKNSIDGAYSYRFPVGFRKILKNRLKKNYYFYSGLDFMRTPVYFPDIWGTYFRILTLKTIEKYLSIINNCNSYHLPAWGYF